MQADPGLSGEVAVSTMLWVSLCVYLVVGLLLWALGPIHRWAGGEPPFAGRRMAGVPGRGGAVALARGDGLRLALAADDSGGVAHSPGQSRPRPGPGPGIGIGIGFGFGR